MRNRISRWQLFGMLFGVWTLLGLIFAGIAYFAAASESRSVSTYSIILSSLGRFYLWAALSPLIFQIVKRFNFGNSKKFFGVFLIYIASGFLFSVLHTTVYICLIWFLDEIFFGENIEIIKLRWSLVFSASASFRSSENILLVICRSAGNIHKFNSN